MIGAVIAPLNAIAGLINAPLQNLYGLIDARIEQLESQGGASAEPAQAEPAPEPELVSDAEVSETAESQEESE
ncbi:MAG: hypothetical protein E6G22_04635 [Actinobacteria bacterium]|nr:MAG: hypothetical protein E6G22_04635 [Actinomycetota bacterium]